MRLTVKIAVSRYPTEPTAWVSLNSTEAARPNAPRMTVVGSCHIAPEASTVQNGSWRNVERKAATCSVAAAA